MSMTWRGPVAFAIALVALGVVAGTVRPEAGRAHSPTARAIPVSNSAVVCPDTTGESDGATVVTVANVSGQLPGGSAAAADVKSTPLSGKSAKTSVLGDHPVSRRSTTADAPAALVVETGQAPRACAAD